MLGGSSARRSCPLAREEGRMESIWGCGVHSNHKNVTWEYENCSIGERRKDLI